MIISYPSSVVSSFISRRTCVAGIFLTTLMAGIPSAGNAAVTELDFEAGIEFVTGGLNPPAIRWSGNGAVPLSGAAWASQPSYNQGFLLGPSDTVGDSYIWMYDTVSGYTDWIEVTAAEPSDMTQGISYDFMNSYRTNPAVNGGNFTDVALVSSDGATIVVANVLTIQAATGGQWKAVEASYDVTVTPWFFGDSVSASTGVPVTQEVLNSIISETGWIVRFGHENISGGYGASGPEFMAADNLTIGAAFAIPEPGSLLLISASVGMAAFSRRRRN